MLRKLLALPASEFYSSDAVPNLLTPLAAQGQQKAGAVTEAYLSKVLDALTDRAVPTKGVDLDPAKLRGGTDPAEVYGRVAEQFRYAQSRREDGYRAAQQRLQLIVSDDLKLAERETAREVLRSEPRVKGYRRVIHPELSRGGTCGLCVAASDRLYSKKDLMPIHKGTCKCTVMPVIGSVDAGKQLNEESLKQLYRAAGGTAKGKLAKVRYQVNQHGELGPVLTPEDEHFLTEHAAQARAT